MEPRSNGIWRSWENFEPFEQRAHRFREDMRPYFFKHLGIAPDSRVLDAGCGSGVFGRYLAQGLTTGHVTGFDINRGAVDLGRARLADLGLADRMDIEEADGFNLHYGDGAFDAVTNYTYLGVLSDPMAGLMELIRVCKPGGTVSCVVATNQIPSAHWQGDYPFEGADELQRLAALENLIFTGFAQLPGDLAQSGQWNAFRYPKLFETCELTGIGVYPFAHLLYLEDHAIALEVRRGLLLAEIDEEIGWLAGRYEGKRDIYRRYGFGDEQYARLQELLKVKAEYVRLHFGERPCHEWGGGYNFIVAGRKPE